MFDYVLMGMVLHEPMTGYDIKKNIEMSIGNFFKVSHGQLYPALKRLTEKKYLTMEEDAQSGRAKKYYQITELGENAFLGWLAAPTDFNTNSDALMVKIFFFGELPEEVRRQRFHEMEIFVQQHLRALREIEAQFADNIKSERDYFEMATLYFGIQNLINVLSWLGHIKEMKPYCDYIQEDKQ